MGGQHRRAFFVSPAIDPILSSLNERVLHFVEEALSIDDATSDDELLKRLVLIGLTDVQAARAVLYRRHYHGARYLDGHTPIRKNKQAILFNPDRQQYELIRC
jgi:hypothetical protein